LQQLQAQGYALFLATAKPIIYAKQILVHFQLDQYFTEMYGSELTGERTNKADLIAYILEQQQLDAQHCIMVGDRKYDIIGARANGIETIAVNYGYGRAEELAQAQPVTQISQFSQLIETVTELNAERKVS
jgi:phosphoglycolate phosphatase